MSKSDGANSPIEWRLSTRKTIGCFDIRQFESDQTGEYRSGQNYDDDFIKECGYEFDNAKCDVKADLNVLEVDFGVLAKVDNRTEEVEQTLVGFERLKQFNQRLGGQLLVVLRGHLDDHLKVLADVGLQRKTII